MATGTVIKKIKIGSTEHPIIDTDTKNTAGADNKVNTTKNMDYTETALGISLIQPVTGTITSRFGRR